MENAYTVFTSTLHEIDEEDYETFLLNLMNSKYLEIMEENDRIYQLPTIP